MLYDSLGQPFLFYKTINNVPAVIKMHPITDLTVNCSCKKTNAKTCV